MIETNAWACKTTHSSGSNARVSRILRNSGSPNRRNHSSNRARWSRGSLHPGRRGGGGDGDCSCHAWGDKARKSCASVRKRMLVPERGGPTTKSGAITRWAEMSELRSRSDCILSLLSRCTPRRRRATARPKGVSRASDSRAFTRRVKGSTYSSSPMRCKPVRRLAVPSSDSADRGSAPCISSCRLANQAANLKRFVSERGTTGSQLWGLHGVNWREGTSAINRWASIAKEYQPRHKRDR